MPIRTAVLLSAASYHPCRRQRGDGDTRRKPSRTMALFSLNTLGTPDLAGRGSQDERRPAHASLDLIMTQIRRLVNTISELQG